MSKNKGADKTPDAWDAWDEFCSEGAKMEDDGAAGSVVVAAGKARSRRAAKTETPKKRPAPVVEEIEEDDDDDDDDDAIEAAVAASITKGGSRRSLHAEDEEEDDEDDEDDEEEEEAPPRRKQKRPPAKKPKLAAPRAKAAPKPKAAPKKLDFDVEADEEDEEEEKPQKKKKKSPKEPPKELAKKTKKKKPTKAPAQRAGEDAAAAEKADKVTPAHALAWVVRNFSQCVEDHTTSPRCPDGPEKMRAILTGLSHSTTASGAANLKPWNNSYIQRTLQTANISGAVSFDLPKVLPPAVAGPFREICDAIKAHGKTHRIDPEFFARLLGQKPRRANTDVIDDTGLVVAHVGANLEKIVAWIEANAE